MEEKKISEQESLELINQMIEQTRRDSTVGSGNTFLIWGYVCMVVSLAVFVAAYTGPGAWGWLYLGIPVMGGVATLIAGRKKTLLDENKGVIKSVDEISGIGHRVVNGGPQFKESVFVAKENV